MKRSGGISNTNTNNAYHHGSSTASALGGGSNGRGMTALSIHAPKPVQTSSLKKENGGQDVNLSIVKGKVGWASAPTVPPPPGTSASMTTAKDPTPERSLHNKQPPQTANSSDGNKIYQHQHCVDQNSSWSAHAGGSAHHSASSHHDTGDNQQHPSKSSSSTARASRWGNVNLDASIDNLPTHHYPSHQHPHYDNHPHNSAAGYPRYNDDHAPSRSYGSPSSSPNRRRGSGNSGYHSHGSAKDDYLYRDHNYRGGGDSRIGGRDAYLHRDYGHYNNHDRDDGGGRYSNFHHRSDNRDRGVGYDRYHNNTDDHSHGSHDNGDNRYHSSSSSRGERRNNNASAPLHPPSPTRNEHPPSSPISQNQHQLPEKSEEDIILQAVREREAAEVRAKLKREQQQKKELEQEEEQEEEQEQQQQQQQQQQHQQQQQEKETEHENREKVQSEEVASSHGTPELEDQEHMLGSEEDGEEEEEEEEEDSEHHLRWGDIDDDDDDESYSESSDSSDHDAHSFQNNYHDNGHHMHSKHDASDHYSHADSHASSGDNAQQHLNWRAEALHDAGPAGNGGFRNYTIASNRRQHHQYQQQYPPYEHPPRSPPRQEHTNYQIYKRPSSPPRHPSYLNNESDRSAKFHQDQQQQHQQQHENMESRSVERDTTTAEDQQEKVEQQHPIEEVLSEEEIERRRKVLLEQQQQNILREVAAKRNATASKKKTRKENQSKNLKRTEHIPGFEGSRPIAPEEEEAKAARLEYARTRGPRTKGMLFLRLDDGTLARKGKDGVLVPKEMQDRGDGKRKGKDGKMRGKQKKRNEKQFSESHEVTEDREDNATTDNDETKVVPAPVPAVSAWKFGPPQGIVSNEGEGLPDSFDESGNHHKDDVDPSSLGCNANAPSWNPSGREEMDSEQKKFAAVAPIMGSWDNFVSRAPGLDEEQQRWDEHHPHEDSHESFPDPHAAVPHDLFSSGDETGKTDRLDSGGGGHKQLGKSRRIPPCSNASDGKKKNGTTGKRQYNPKNKKRSEPSFRSKDGKDYKHNKDRSEGFNEPPGSAPDTHQRSSKKEPHSSRKDPKRSLEGKKNQTLRSGTSGSNKPGGAKQGHHEYRKKGSRPNNNNTKPRKPRTQHVKEDVDNAVKCDVAT